MPNSRTCTNIVSLVSLLILINKPLKSPVRTLPAIFEYPVLPTFVPSGITCTELFPRCRFFTRPPLSHDFSYGNLPPVFLNRHQIACKRVLMCLNPAVIASTISLALLSRCKMGRSVVQNLPVFQTMALGRRVFTCVNETLTPGTHLPCTENPTPFLGPLLHPPLLFVSRLGVSSR